MHITLVEFNPSGGLFHVAVQLSEALAEEGHKVDLITGRRPELLPRVPGVTLKAILPTWHAFQAGRSRRPRYAKLRRVWRAGLLLLAWLKVGRELRSADTDAVIWSIWRFALDGWFAARLAARKDRPLMAVLAHEPRPINEAGATGRFDKAGPLLDRALNAAYAGMDVAFVFGEQVRRTLVEARPYIRRVEVIPLGAGDLFVRSEVPSARHTPMRVLFFGTWSRYKGLDVLLEAFRQVRRRLPEAELIVAGTVTKQVDLAAIQQQAKQIGGVQLQTGYVPAEQVEPLFASVRALVAPHRHVSQSGVIHLAHTFARPVIATRLGDMPSVVLDGVTGLLVPPEDPEALAGAIERLLVDPVAAERLGREGKERLAREGSWQVAAQRVASVFQELRHPD